MRDFEQKKPIRVIRIIDRLNIGGPAKHVVWLTVGLNDGDFQTTLVTGTVPSDEGDMRYFADAADVRPLVIPELSREISLLDVFVVFKLVRLFFRLRPDIVHTHKAKAGATGRIAAVIYRWATLSCLWGRPRRCRVVHTFHGHIFHGYYSAAKSKMFLAIEQMLSRSATDKLVTLSAGQCEELASRYRIGSPSQFRVIPLGLDFDEMPAEITGLRKNYGIASDVPLIGFVGRFCEVKNLSMLLDVARCLLDQGVTAKFILVGDGYLRPSLTSRAEELGLGGTVLFTGFRKDALSLYPELDIVVLTSVNEGTPLTLIEAMASGRPVASTEVGGVPDMMGRRCVLKKQFTIWDHGITARSGDAMGFAEGLHYLIGDVTERKKMGERGKIFVKENFLISRLIKDISALYREVNS
jgi:glycosyltransferase involved in cell wall biosynthesis